MAEGGISFLMQVFFNSEISASETVIFMFKV